MDAIKDTQAPFYENPAVIGSCASLPRTRAALAFARELRPTRILDLGSGDGDASLALQAGTGGMVTCADISDVAVGKCREKGLEAQRIEAGMGELPFRRGSFDLVVMAEVVEHLINPAKALDEVHRVLKPNGHLILSTPNLACFPNRFLLALGFQPLFSEVSERHVVGRGLRTLGQRAQPVGHLRLYTKRALLEFLEQCKFRKVKLRGVPFHETGPLHGLERFTGVLPSFAMILVVVAQPNSPSD